MSVTLEPIPFDRLDEEGSNLVLVHMLTTSRAVDLFLGDLTRRSRSETGRTANSYRLLLDHFADSLGSEDDVTKISPDDCRRFLDRYAKHSKGYQATIHATLNSFLEWLYQQQRIKKNPLDHVRRPRRARPEDLDVVTVDTVDVPKLLAAARGDAERNAVAIACYLGPRRRAISRLRLSDYDREKGTIRFQEKGTKTIVKPVPYELAQILNSAIDRGAIWPAPADYLVPPEGALIRKGERDDRVIYRLVNLVGTRAGIPVHVHALRAAFACFYLENNPNDLVGLQELMGHRSSETTKTYLRKLNKQRAMAPVRTLSWAGVAAGNMADALKAQVAGIGFAEPSLMGAGGFEPPNVVLPHEHRAGTKQAGDSP